MQIRSAVAAAVIAIALTGVSVQSAEAAAAHYANCTAMHKVYPHGVGKSGARDHVKGTSKPVTNFKVSNALYAANAGSDGDHDGVACEAH